MTEIKILELCGQIVVTSAIVTLWTWVAIYTAMAKWWKNPIGRTTVLQAGVIALLLIPTLINMFFDLSMRAKLDLAWTQIGLIGTITPLMISRIWLWFKLAEQHRLTNKRQIERDDS